MAGKETANLSRVVPPPRDAAIARCVCGAVFGSAGCCLIPHLICATAMCWRMLVLFCLKSHVGFFPSDLRLVTLLGRVERINHRRRLACRLVSRLSWWIGNGISTPSTQADKTQSGRGRTCRLVLQTGTACTTERNILARIEQKPVAERTLKRQRTEKQIPVHICNHALLQVMVREGQPVGGGTVSSSDSLLWWVIETPELRVDELRES